jgi:serine/threonine protein kinase
MNCATSFAFWPARHEIFQNLFATRNIPPWFAKVRLESNNMGTEQKCSTCGKALEANAPAGLCPECLIQVGLGSGVDPGAGTETGAARRDFVPPTVETLGPLFPQLEILELIGKGGMGAVYKARQRELDRIVALKILPPDVGLDAAFAGRFTREARALARLNHPGIVTLYEFGRANGLYFFLMEYVDGVNLQQLLAGGRVSPREALAIVPQICDALQYAHDQGIVHRDIKPGNILLDRRGRVKVADFGLAKLMETDAPTPSLSHRMGEGGTPVPGEEPPPALSDASKVMGTPQYMSPEQISAPGEVDHRADIYALGVVFYQMLTGELPGKPLQPPSKKVQVDVRLDEIVLRALEMNPKLRYQQVSEVKTMVESLSSSSSPVTGTAAGAGKPWQSPTMGWGHFIGYLFGCTFTSPLAYKLANLSALGFLSCLAFLGFLPLPGMRRCFGFFGFFGFFGLIGVATMVEMVKRRQANKPATGSVAGAPPDRSWRRPVLTLVLVPLVLVLAALPLVAFWRGAAKQTGADILPEIESVEVSPDQAVVKQRHFHGEGMILTFGPITNRWEPGSAHLDHLFDITLEPHWFRRDAANWVIKSRHGIYSNYRLDGPPGPMLGKIVFHPGTPAPAADGAYVIGEFQPDDGVPLPIAVRLEKDPSPSVRVPETKSGPPASEARLRQIQAAQVELPYAEAELARLTKLHSSNVISDQVFSEAKYKVEELKAESKGDEAEVLRIQLRQAEENRARAKDLFGRSLIGQEEYEQAKLKVELLRAQLAPIPVPSPSTNPAGLVELKLKWPPGKRYVEDVDFKQNTDFLLQGRSNTVKEDITMGNQLGLTVLQEAPDGGHDIELEFLSARMGMKMGDQTILDFNSANQSVAGKTSGVAAVFGKIVASKLRYFLNAGNDAERLEGVGELVQRIQSVPDTDPLTDGIKAIFGAAYFEAFTNTSPFLPRHAVQPGDTWSSHAEFPVAAVGIEVWDYKVVFQSWEMHGNHRCARLELQGTMKVKPDPNLKRDETTYRPRDGVAEGVAWFDPELGQMDEAEMKNEINVDKQPRNPSGTPNAAGQRQTLTTQRHQVITIKLER